MMEVVKEREMKLLSRKRITLIRENNGATPSRQQLLTEVASQFKISEDLVVIKHIYPQFGENKTKIIVHMYTDKKKMSLFEHANLLKKHEKKVEEKIEEEKPAVEEPKKEVTEKEEESAAAEKTEEENQEKLAEKKEEKPAENKE